VQPVKFGTKKGSAGLSSGRLECQEAERYTIPEMRKRLARRMSGPLADCFQA
jgi:hypothetical protein